MTTTLQTLTEDIAEAIATIGKMSSPEYLKVYSIYKNLYNRFANLDESEFIDLTFYNDHLKSLSQTTNLELYMLKERNPDYIGDGFPAVLTSLGFLTGSVKAIGTN